MKIGYFVTHYPYEKEYDDYFCGGVGAVAENLAKEMAKRGHEVLIFTTSRTRKYSFEEREGIKIYRYGADFRIAEAYMSFRLLFGPLKHGVDIVHVQAGNPPAPLVALRYAEKKNKPFVITYHGDVQENFGGLIRRISVSFYIKHFLDKVLSRANVIILPSAPFIETSRFLKVYKDKIVVVPNGVNLECFDVYLEKEECKKHFSFKPEDIIISSLGALTLQKGFHVLIKAMPKIFKKNPDAKLLIGGIGPMEKDLKELSHKLGINKSVKFCGFVNKDIVSLFYKATDLFVFPSSMEGDLFPIVLLEASAAGLPMVVSDLPTLECIVNEGFNGLFTKRGDEESLADAIIYLLENESIRKKMSENARKKVEEFTWNRIAKRTEEIYYEALS